MVQDYPRAADLPGPGFAAGPCLLKDTMQLAAFNNNNFALGQASMQINEGLPLYLVSRLAARYDLDSMTVGILGMAFKGESDDNRSSLSYKLKRVLKVRAKKVLTTDPYVTVDDEPLAARPGPRSVRSHRDRSTPQRLRRPRHHPTGRGHLEPSRRWGGGVKPRVSIVIPAYNEGSDIEDVLSRLIEAVRVAVGDRGRGRSPDDATVPYVEKYADRNPHIRCLVNDVEPGPAQAIRFGIERAVGRCGGGDHGRWMRRPSADRSIGAPGRARCGRRCRLEVLAGGSAGGRARSSRELLSRMAGLSLWALARVGTRDATNSFKAYDVGFVHSVGITSTAGFEIGIELVAKARRARLPVAELPTIWLERQPGCVKLQADELASRITCAGGVSPSARASPSTRCGPPPIGEDLNEHCSGHWIGRIHRWLCGQGAARSWPRRGRASTTIPSTARFGGPTTTIPGTGSSRVTPGTSI